MTVFSLMWLKKQKTTEEIIIAIFSKKVVKKDQNIHIKIIYIGWHSEIYINI